MASNSSFPPPALFLHGIWVALSIAKHCFMLQRPRAIQSECNAILEQVGICERTTCGLERGRKSPSRIVSIAACYYQSIHGMNCQKKWSTMVLTFFALLMHLRHLIGAEDKVCAVATTFRLGNGVLMHAREMR